MERNFTRKFELLHQQQTSEYADLLFAAESLMLHASSQLHPLREEFTPHLPLFKDSPRVTQAVWEGEDAGNKYYRDSLAMTLIDDSLVVGIHTQEPSELRRNIVIGPHYAHYNEYLATRADHRGEHDLDAEHIALFSGHFDAMVARFGLSKVITSRALQLQAA